MTAYIRQIIYNDRRRTLMPKNVVKIKQVNKEVFSKIIKEKGSSIRKLGNTEGIDCSEKTIRRELNTRGGLREQYLDQIARHLNVDSRLLSGELVEKAFTTTDKGMKSIYLYPLAHIEDYPYFREEQDRLRVEHIDETLKRILLLFEVSYEQFKAKTFEEQYDFQHDLLSAILPVRYKHFDRDGYGNTERMSFEAIIVSLENYQDDYYERKYADTTLREKFMQNLPEGYTPSQIKKMSPDELIGLDMYLQSLEYPEDKDD